jgi:hypothetical protein
VAVVEVELEVPVEAQRGLIGGVMVRVLTRASLLPTLHYYYNRRKQQRYNLELLVLLR